MRIQSLAYALPSEKVDNEAVIERVLQGSREHLSDDQRRELEKKLRVYFRLSGTKIRYQRAPGEIALDFGLKAGRAALEKAGVDAADVDLLIYAGVGRGWLEPATANVFQAELGLKNATCFDVLDACASWIRSLSVAQAFLEQGTYRRILVLNCELNVHEYAGYRLERLEQLENFFSGYTIGEAATATVLERGEPSEDFLFTFRTWGDKHGLCKVPLSNAQEFAPRGSPNHLRPLTFFTSPTELVSFASDRAVEQYLSLPEFVGRRHDLLLGHAVGEHVAANAFKRMGLDPALVFETHARFGNTVSATLPLGLAAAEEDGRLRRGMRVLLCMGSAGVTTSLVSFRY